MPHRQHVECAAGFQSFGLGSEPQAKLHQIRQALVAFMLEMVLGRPQRVVAEIVHHASHVARGKEHLAEAFVRIAPVIRRRTVDADIVQVDLADIKDVEAFDHLGSSLFSTPSPA